MISTEPNGRPNEKDGQGSFCFSALNCLTPDQETMIAQRITSELKRKDTIPGEVGENGKAQKVKFTKPVRDDVMPLLEKGAKLGLGRFNSLHETIYQLGSFIADEVDPVLRKWKVSFRWFMKTVSDVSGIQSRGSWNNHRVIFKAFGEKLKTDPDVRTVPEGKLLACAKHDNPVEFVNSHIDQIRKSSRAELEELVTGKKWDKREPVPDRYYKNLNVRGYWSEAREELRLKVITPDLLEAIYDLLEDRDSEAQEMDNALSTVLDDGSFDWSGYWQNEAKNSEITISYTTTEGQYTFWNPEKGTVPYGTWAEVIEAIRTQNSEAYIIAAEGPEHRIAETSLAESVPQTSVTIPKELLDQLVRKPKGQKQSESSENQEPVPVASEPTETEQRQDLNSDGDASQMGENTDAHVEFGQESSAEESSEEESDWTPGDGWTPHQGSLDLRDVFEKVGNLDERWVDVHVSVSGRMDDSKQVDMRYEHDIPQTWSALIGYFESEEFAPYRSAKLIWFTNEGGKPYLYARNGHGWKVWSNVSAIPLSN